MKKLFVTLLGASLVPLVVIGCGGQGASNSETVDTPEAAAINYRQSVMGTLQYKVAQARGMAQGEIPADEAVFKKHASDVAALAGMVPEGFIPNSQEGSNALPEVWMNMADFRQKASDLQMAAQSLATAAEQNGFEASKGMVQAVGQACGACHRPYRRRQE
jgi:cytochrome c556